MPPRAGRARRSWEGWPLVGLAAAGLAALAAATLALEGLGEEGVRALIRASARSSLALFLLAFTASSLRRLWRAPATAWLLRNRRQIGVSFALSQLLHLGAIAAFALGWTERFAESVSPVTVAGGGVGYVFTAAMAATSSDRAVAWLGARRWRLLHRTGIWVLWVIFVATYVPGAFVAPAHRPLAALALAAAALRAAVHLGGRRTARSVPASSASVGQ